MGIKTGEENSKKTGYAFTIISNLYFDHPVNWKRQSEFNKLTTLVEVFNQYFSDSGSLPDISTENK